MLLTEDPQMQPVQTPFGVVTFLQVRSRLDMGSSLPRQDGRVGKGMDIFFWSSPSF